MFSLSKKKKIEIGMSQEKDSRSSRWEEETGKSTEENNDNEIVLDGGASSKNTQQQQQQELSEISSTVGISEKDRYKLPNWTGQPPRNTHLDVIKSDRLLNKVLIDEKGGVYYFGRSLVDCDIVIEHASCSRVHAVLLYHKVLKRFTIVDLESSHGTFVENTRIEPLKPVFLDFDSAFHFGASTRQYVLRIMADLDDSGAPVEDLNPQTSKKQQELDDITEYNTMQNRRIPQIPMTLEEARRKTRQRGRINFNDDDEVINPEDVDPTVGRFRNLIKMAVIPTSGLKRKHSNESLAQKDQLFDFYAPDSKRRSGNQFSTTSSRAASSDSPATRLAGMSLDGSGSAFSSSTLGGMISLNAAPDAEMYAPPPSSGPSGAFSSKNPQMSASMGLPPKKQRFGPHPRGVGTTEASGIVVPSDLLAGEDDGHGHSKKKYAKEAWPKDLRPTSVL